MSQTGVLLSQTGRSFLRQEWSYVRLDWPYLKQLYRSQEGPMSHRKGLSQTGLALSQPERACLRQEGPISDRSGNIWLSDTYLVEKRKRRKLEKKMKRTKLEVDKQAFKLQKNKTNELLNENKSDFFKKLIDENKDNPHDLFKVMNSALNRKQDTQFPPHSSDTDLANEFSDFFTDKIDKIRDKLDNESQHQSTDIIHEIGKFNTTLSEFTPLSEDQVRELVKKSPTKHCELDPMPKWLVKDCLEEVLPTLTKIINLSLQLGDMPLSLKHAIIKPLLKKMGLELIHKTIDLFLI